MKKKEEKKKRKKKKNWNQEEGEWNRRSKIKEKGMGNVDADKRKTEKATERVSKEKAEDKGKKLST